MTVARSVARSVARPVASSPIRGGGLVPPAPTLQFLQVATSAADLSTYTFAAQSLGEPVADRMIVVCVHARVATTVSVSAVSVGGVNATSLISSTGGTGPQSIAALFIAEVPAGLYGDVVVTLSAAAVRAGIQVYRLTGVNATPVITSVLNNAETISVPTNGIVISAANAISAVGVSWVGLPQDSLSTVETLTVTSASLRASAAQSVSVNATWDGGINAPRVLAVLGAA